jgi:hypothetical protein
MIDSKIIGLLELIETRYGPYSGEEHAAVGNYLGARIGPEFLAQAFDAIRQECPIHYGPPDVATVKKALVAYEIEYGVSLRRITSERSAPRPEPVTEEDSEELRRMAERKGIDTTREDWLRMFMFRTIGELASAKAVRMETAGGARAST